MTASELSYNGLVRYAKHSIKNHFTEIFDRDSNGKLSINEDGKAGFISDLEDYYMLYEGVIYYSDLGDISNIGMIELQKVLDR